MTIFESPADYFLEQGELADAIQALRHELQSRTPPSGQWLELALLLCLQDYEQHCQEIRNLHALSEPEQRRSGLWNYVGGVMAIKEHQYPDAIACFRQCTRQNPAECSYWAALGEALYLDCQYEQALACVQNGLEIDDENEQCRNLRTSVLLALGRQ
ncbi:MAG: hypothetical protein KDK39_07705 [Leptospiraceae bacterium]|nr:hypothetical protein [Leptospiraceae bacterium]